MTFSQLSWGFGCEESRGRVKTAMGTLLQGQLVPGHPCPRIRDIAHPGRSGAEQIQPGMPLEGPWASGTRLTRGAATCPSRRG